MEPTVARIAADLAPAVGPLHDVCADGADGLRLVPVCEEREERGRREKREARREKREEGGEITINIINKQLQQRTPWCIVKGG